MTKIVVLSKFDGGLSLIEPTDIGNNQFSTLQNFYYDAQSRLRTRRGVETFGDLLGAPITSYFFHVRDDNGGKLAVCVSGTSMYKLDNTTKVWSVIQAGLTQYEPTDTTKRTRWDFAVYKNVMYACNGVDPYMSITIPGGVVTQYLARPLVRYVEYMQDRVFGFGEDLNPNTLYYSAAAPADGTTFNTNAVVIGGDEQGIGTGLFEAGQVIVAGKSKKIFSVNILTPLATPLDTQNGLYSQRALQSFGNGTLYFNDLGVNFLRSRQGVEGGGALQAEALSTDVQLLIEEIQPRYFNSNCGGVINELNNYYFSFDTSNEDTPDTTLVRSAITKSWSKYTIPPAYQYGTYIEDSGEVRYLIASAVTGQMYEIETGFDDNGSAIDYELQTKDFDFGNPEEWKDFDYVEILGLMNEGGTVYTQSLIDGETVADGTITDANLTSSGTAFPIGIKPIGTYPIGGGGSSDIVLYPYRIRIPLLGAGGGTRLSVKMFSNTTPMAWTLNRIIVSYNGNTVDVFPYANIA
jgi:hypothetical protein